FAGDAGDADAAVVRGLGDHALESLLPALVDDLGHLRDLAADDAAPSGGEAAEQAHREDAVADDQVSRAHVLEVKAVDFVAGEAGEDGHEGLLPLGPTNVAAGERECTPSATPPRSTIRACPIPSLQGRSFPNWTSTSSASRTPSGPWRWPSATAGGGSS